MLSYPDRDESPQGRPADAVAPAATGERAAGPPSPGAVPGADAPISTRITELFGIELPIFGFTPSEHVAAAITRAGGLGVLGCVRFTDPGELDATLDWMDANTDGKPYGVDIVMPAKIPTEGSVADLNELIPRSHSEFVTRTLHALGVPELPPEPDAAVLGWLHSVARSHADVALRHRISLLVNALGAPPRDVVEQAHRGGVKVAALAGTVGHALHHVETGVDIVVAQGYEAGGHTGEVASMVLVPEIVDAVGAHTPVLAAGGIGTGRQVAAALALGADGVWMGSRWLTAAEYQLGGAGDGTPTVIQQAMIAASSSDTVRSRVYTGKPARLLRTRWTQAWESPDAPEPLPMPLQNVLVNEAHRRISAADDPSVVAMPVGQIVGRMTSIEPVAAIIDDLVSGYRGAVRGLPH